MADGDWWEWDGKWKEARDGGGVINLARLILDSWTTLQRKKVKGDTSQ